MIRFLVSFHILLFLGCGGSDKNSETVIGGAEPEVITIPILTDTEPVITVPVIPNGAITGDFNGDFEPFYAYMAHIDTKKEITYISFENKSLPQISIPKTFGGTVSKIALEGFDRDLLLVTAKLKDPNFNKYFLYLLRDNKWNPVVNGFAIHVSNLSAVEQPLQLNPDHPNELMRYYSVFDLDQESELGYTWRLLQESIPIMYR